MYIKKVKRILLCFYGNGEDLAFNKFIEKYYKENAVYVEGRYTRLDTSEGYSSMDSHYKERGEFCKKFT